MARKRLDQYMGRLNPAQIAEGMNVALVNAKLLVDAANILYENENYALAASVATLSIEESGKVRILRSLAVARNDKEVIQCWRDYRSHTKKNMMWPFLQLFAEGARRLNDFASLFVEEAEHPFLLDQIKQLGFYSDCLGKAHWSNPKDIIDKDLAKTIIKTAAIFARPHHVSEEEIKLWVKHMAPVWKGPKEHMEHGLVEWYKEMKDQGLIEGEADSMEDFIVSGMHNKDMPNSEREV